jgi:hypothetical protein
MNLNDLRDEYLEDDDDWLTYIEVRHYCDEEDEEYFEGIDVIFVSYVMRDGGLVWVKAPESSRFFQEYEEWDENKWRFIFVDGPVSHGGYDQIEVKPVAHVCGNVYFEPI